MPGKFRAGRETPRSEVQEPGPVAEVKGTPVNTLQDVIAAYQGYKRAFTEGAFAQGWRLPGRTTNRCGSAAKTDSPFEFAIRAHNSAVAQVKLDLGLLPVKEDQDPGGAIDGVEPFITPIAAGIVDDYDDEDPDDE